MTGLKQGPLAKNPWAVDPALGGSVPLADVVLTWPVHDGDVGASFVRRLIESIFYRSGGSNTLRVLLHVAG